MISLANAQKYSLTLALIGLLLPMNIGSASLGVFLLVSLISMIKNWKKHSFQKHQFLFAGFFLLFPIALVYTEDLTYGLKLLERNIAWFLLPVLAPFALSIKKKDLFKALHTFAWAVHAMVLFLGLFALWRYMETKDPLVFYYDELVSVVKFHPVYLSVYLLFSLLIFAEGWKKKRLEHKLFFKIGIIAFDLVLLILLSSKMVLALFFIVVLIVVLKDYKSKKIVLSSLTGMVLLVAIIMQFPETRNRINDSLFSSWELLDKETFKYNDPFTGITLRLITWKFVMDKFAKNENVLIGLGTGDAKEYINQVYRERKMDDGGYIDFNMHNQYLEYILKFGLIGFLYFITILFLSFKRAIKERNGLYFSFLLIFCMFSITESNLEVQRGIVFFVLINTIFYFFSFRKSELVE